MYRFSTIGFSKKKHFFLYISLSTSIVRSLRLTSHIHLTLTKGKHMTKTERQKLAGKKAAVSRRFNAKIKEAEALGNTRSAAAFKANKTRQLRALETA